MASAGRAEPRCSFEIADKIVTLLRTDEEARNRWNTLLGRGISASMRDTFLSYRNGRRAEYSHQSATRSQKMETVCCPQSAKTIRFIAALSRAKVVS